MPCFFLFQCVLDCARVQRRITQDGEAARDASRVGRPVLQASQSHTDHDGLTRARQKGENAAAHLVRHRNAAQIRPQVSPDRLCVSLHRSAGHLKEEKVLLPLIISSELIRRNSQNCSISVKGAIRLVLNVIFT